MPIATPDSVDFDALHACLRPRVPAYLRRFVSASEAEDLVQEVFLKVHLGLASFRGESKVTTWVFQIATHAAVDHLRRSRPGPDLVQWGGNHCDEPPDPPSPSQGVAPVKEEMCRCIQGLVHELPVSYRAVLLLSEMKEIGISEAGKILGISPGAAKIRLHRARRLLRDRMVQGCRILLDERAVLQCDRKTSR